MNDSVAGATQLGLQLIVGEVAVQVDEDELPLVFKFASLSAYIWLVILTVDLTSEKADHVPEEPANDVLTGVVNPVLNVVEKVSL